MRRALVLLALFPLAACVSAPPPPPRQIGEMPSNKVWARTDGQRMAGNPALFKKGQTDLQECRQLASTGEPNQYDLVTLNSCMTERGYMEIDKPA